MNKKPQEKIQRLPAIMQRQRAISSEERTMQPLRVEDVVTVYEGLAGECCCGCAGKYYYSPAFTELITEYVREDLIRQPKPEEFNQEKIITITALVKEHIECGATEYAGGGCYFLELRGLRCHLFTTAEYELRRRLNKGQAATNRQQPTVTRADN